MKPFIVTLVILCVAITGGTIVCLKRQKTPPIPGPIAESSSRQTEQMHVEQIVVSKQEEPRTASDKASEPTPIPVTNSVSRDLKPDSAATALSQTVDTLVSAQTSFSDKQALWRQLKKAGGLDQVIAELKQRAAGNPNDPWIPTALGEAYLNKFPVQDYNEAAILGLQADQSFDAAIKLDPSNWEAQYFKAASLSHWPPEMNKGPEVIQRFSALIDQQETMPQQPEFAQAYVLLGEQYQKAGQPDYAQQTWRLGLAKFPGDRTLQKRISGL